MYKKIQMQKRASMQKKKAQMQNKKIKYKQKTEMQKMHSKQFFFNFIFLHLFMILFF